MEALAYWRDLGVRELAVARPGTASPAASAVPAAPALHTAHAAPPAPPAAESPAAASPPASLEELRERVASCTLCSLAETRRQTVFCDGSPSARIFFVGEAPGADEDAQGVPFVGRAGQLLTKMIEGGMGLSRGDVYIANILKCRPPGNRNPLPPEIAACQPYLVRQIEAVRPEALVALGNFAAQFLLETEEGIMRIHGKWGSWRGIPVMPTFHPSFLLRQPDRKKDAWADLLAVLDRLGIARPRAAFR